MTVAPDALDLHLPDAMGVWDDGGEVIWLPRAHYPNRTKAIIFAKNEWGCDFTEVRCRTRWMRYDPYIARNEDGSVAWSEDRWIECEKSEPRAFQVWRLEDA